MAHIASDEVQQIKQNLGKLVVVDWGNRDMLSAHLHLGTVVQRQVHSYLQKKLDNLDRGELIDEIRIARRSKHAIQLRLDRSDISENIKDALRDYLECLTEWITGSQLKSFGHEKLTDLRVDGTAVTGEDLAFLLQNEETGCQTGVARDNDGSVWMWHTEEDVEIPLRSRVDRVTLFSFRSKRGRRITSFIYPDLLPGPAFGWSDNDLVQAVDTLNVRTYEGHSAISANLVAWLNLYLGPDLSAHDLIHAIGPIRNGYAITSMQRQEGTVEASKIEFAGDQFLHASLPHQPGSHLFQVNIFSQRNAQIAITYEQVTSSTKAQLERRIKRTTRALKAISLSQDKKPYLLRLLSSRVGGEFAYCNRDVKAYLLCRYSLHDMVNWVGVGPALQSDPLTRVA